MDKPLGSGAYYKLARFDPKLLPRVIAASVPDKVQTILGADEVTAADLERIPTVPGSGEQWATPLASFTSFRCSSGHVPRHDHSANINLLVPWSGRYKPHHQRQERSRQPPSLRHGTAQRACPPLSQGVEFTAMFPADPVCSKPGCERPGTVYRFSGNPFQRVCPTHRIHMRREDPFWLARSPCATCSAERIRTTLTSAAHWTGASATSQCWDCGKAEIEAELGGCKTCGCTGVRRRRSSSDCLRCSTHIRTQVARGVPDADITPWSAWSPTWAYLQHVPNECQNPDYKTGETTLQPWFVC